MARIHLVTLGTEGDVRPFVALGKALTARGHHVVLATHDEFEGLATRHGLEFRSIGNSMKAILASDAGRAWIDSSDRFFEYTRTLRVMGRQMLEEHLKRAPAILAGADAVVAQAFAVFAFHDAERAKVPIAFVGMVPMVETAEQPPVFFPGAPAWGWLRRGLHRLTLRLMARTVLDLHEDYRRSIGLAPLATKNPIRHWARSGVPFFHAFSETLVPRPTDWPETAVVNGVCELPEPGLPVPEGLEAFLASGEPPVYIGFGSMTGSRTEALGRVVREALEVVGCRAVVATGWGQLPGVVPNDTVFVAERINHAWLFPRVAAVVHHGGLGTLTAGLRAGRPTAVVAFLGDQPYWGRVANSLGVGPPPLRRRDVTSERLATLLRDVLGTPSYTVAAGNLGVRLRAEDGSAQLASAIDGWLETQRRGSLTK